MAPILVCVVNVAEPHEIFLIPFSMLEIEIKSVPVRNACSVGIFHFLPHKLIGKIISTQWRNNEAIFSISEIDRKGIKYTCDYFKTPADVVESTKELY